MVVFYLAELSLSLLRHLTSFTAPCNGNEILIVLKGSYILAHCEFLIPFLMGVEKIPGFKASLLLLDTNSYPRKLFKDTNVYSLAHIRDKYNKLSVIEN